MLIYLFSYLTVIGCAAIYWSFSAIDKHPRMHLLVHYLTCITSVFFTFACVVLLYASIVRNDVDFNFWLITGSLLLMFASIQQITLIEERGWVNALYASVFGVCSVAVLFFDTVMICRPIY